jgi:K+-transporting ATPase ATPase A chain
MMLKFILDWLILQAVVLALAYPLAKYVYVLQSRTYSLKWEKKFLSVLGCSLAPMRWQQYLFSFLLFQFIGWLVLFITAITQASSYQINLAQAFELASSFVTNTNWLSLSGEYHWSLPLWLLGIIGQNFLSAASGLCVLLVFARSFKAKQENLGNFWVDIWRMNIYVLLPLAMMAALPLIWQGVPQNFQKNLVIHQYENPKLTQLIPMGPIAAQESIKLLGTNGGGYTFANSAHPFENPSLMTDYEEMFLMLLLPIMGIFLFARIVGRLSYAWSLYAVMFMLSTLLMWSAFVSEPPNLLGKELRFGSLNSVLWHGITTATATGATSAILDQFYPMTSGFFLFLMNIGEIAFGGVGLGVVNLLFVFILTAFILGLLTGSSPVFIKNKLSLSVIKLSMLFIIIVPCFILMTLIASFVMNRAQNLGDVPYLLLSSWYNISSWLNNNGSGFLAWVPASNVWHYLCGTLMIVGRYLPIILAFVVAGQIAHQQVIESSQQVIDLDSKTFVIATVVIIFIVTLLAYLPLWSLGPLALQGLSHI